MTDIVLVDLDSTLADTRQRRHLCPTVDDTKTWTDYALGCADDEPIEGVVALIQTLHSKGIGAVIVSHRDPAAAALTRSWLDGHKIPYLDVCLGVNKVGALRYLRENGWNVLFAIDDDPDICATYERAGLPVVCVNPRYAHRP